MSEPFRRIVVGVDLGPHGHVATPGSRLALGRARWLAERFGSRVTVVHSGARDEHWDTGEASFVVAEEGIDDDGRKALDGAVGELRRAGVDTRLEPSNDPAWLAIIRTALRDDADLVLASKRSEPVNDGRRIGSVARKLLRKAPCAVWLEDLQRRPDPRVSVAATDLTTVGDLALGLAARLAGELEADLDVVHAFSLPMSVQMEGGAAERTWLGETTDRIEGHLREQLAGTAVAERARLCVGLTSPSSAILSVARRSDADLLVMGTVSRGGIPGFLMGNTAERIFDSLDCALLAVKPADFVCPVELPDS